MPVPPTTTDGHTLLVLAMITSALCVIYWRHAIRLFVIVMIALAVYGAITGLHI